MNQNNEHEIFQNLDLETFPPIADREQIEQIINEIKFFFKHSPSLRLVQSTFCPKLFFEKPEEKLNIDLTQEQSLLLQKFQKKDSKQMYPFLYFNPALCKYFVSNIPQKIFRVSKKKDFYYQLFCISFYSESLMLLKFAFFDNESQAKAAHHLLEKLQKKQLVKKKSPLLPALEFISDKKLIPELLFHWTDETSFFEIQQELVSNATAFAAVRNHLFFGNSGGVINSISFTDVSTGKFTSEYYLCNSIGHQPYSIAWAFNNLWIFSSTQAFCINISLKDITEIPNKPKELIPPVVSDGKLFYSVKVHAREVNIFSYDSIFQEFHLVRHIKLGCAISNSNQKTNIPFITDGSLISFAVQRLISGNQQTLFRVFSLIDGNWINDYVVSDIPLIKCWTIMPFSTGQVVLTDKRVSFFESTLQIPRWIFGLECPNIPSTIAEPSLFYYLETLFFLGGSLFSKSPITSEDFPILLAFFFEKYRSLVLKQIKKCRKDPNSTIPEEPDLQKFTIDDCLCAIRCFGMILLHTNSKGEMMNLCLKQFHDFYLNNPSLPLEMKHFICFLLLQLNDQINTFSIDDIISNYLELMQKYFPNQKHLLQKNRNSFKKSSNHSALDISSFHHNNIEIDQFEKDESEISQQIKYSSMSYNSFLYFIWIFPNYFDFSKIHLSNTAILTLMQFVTLNWYIFSTEANQIIRNFLVTYVAPNMRDSFISIFEPLHIITQKISFDLNLVFQQVISPNSNIFKSDSKLWYFILRLIMANWKNWPNFGHIYLHLFELMSIKMNKRIDDEEPYKMISLSLILIIEILLATPVRKGTITFDSIESFYNSYSNPLNRIDVSIDNVIITLLNRAYDIKTTEDYSKFLFLVRRSILFSDKNSKQLTECQQLETPNWSAAGLIKYLDSRNLQDLLPIFDPNLIIWLTNTLDVSIYSFNLYNEVIIISYLSKLIEHFQSLRFNSTYMNASHSFSSSLSTKLLPNSNSFDVNLSDLSLESSSDGGKSHENFFMSSIISSLKFFHYPFLLSPRFLREIPDNTKHCFEVSQITSLSTPMLELCVDSIVTCIPFIKNIQSLTEHCIGPCDRAQIFKEFTDPSCEPIVYRRALMKYICIKAGIRIKINVIDFIIGIHASPRAAKVSLDTMIAAEKLEIFKDCDITYIYDALMDYLYTFFVKKESPFPQQLQPYQVMETIFIIIEGLKEFLTTSSFKIYLQTIIYTLTGIKSHPRKHRQLFIDNSHLLEKNINSSINILHPLSLTPQNTTDETPKQFFSPLKRSSSGIYTIQQDFDNKDDKCNSTNLNSLNSSKPVDDSSSNHDDFLFFTKSAVNNIQNSLISLKQKPDNFLKNFTKISTQIQGFNLVEKLSPFNKDKLKNDRFSQIKKRPSNGINSWQIVFSDKNEDGIETNQLEYIKSKFKIPSYFKFSDPGRTIPIFAILNNSIEIVRPGVHINFLDQNGVFRKGIVMKYNAQTTEIAVKTITKNDNPDPLIINDGYHILHFNLENCTKILCETPTRIDLSYVRTFDIYAKLFSLEIKEKSLQVFRYASLLEFSYFHTFRKVLPKDLKHRYRHIKWPHVFHPEDYFLLFSQSLSLSTYPTTTFQFRDSSPEYLRDAPSSIIHNILLRKIYQKQPKSSSTHHHFSSQRSEFNTSNDLRGSGTIMTLEENRLFVSSPIHPLINGTISLFIYPSQEEQLEPITLQAHSISNHPEILFDSDPYFFGVKNQEPEKLELKINTLAFHIEIYRNSSLSYFCSYQPSTEMLFFSLQVPSGVIIDYNFTFDSKISHNTKIQKGNLDFISILNPKHDLNSESKLPSLSSECIMRSRNLDFSNHSYGPIILPNSDSSIFNNGQLLESSYKLVQSFKLLLALNLTKKKPRSGPKVIIKILEYLDPNPLSENLNLSKLKPVSWLFPQASSLMLSYLKNAKPSISTQEELNNYILEIQNMIDLYAFSPVIVENRSASIISPLFPNCHIENCFFFIKDHWKTRGYSKQNEKSMLKDPCLIIPMDSIHGSIFDICLAFQHTFMLGITNSFYQFSQLYKLGKDLSKNSLFKRALTTILNLIKYISLPDLEKSIQDKNFEYSITFSNISLLNPQSIIYRYDNLILPRLVDFNSKTKIIHTTLPTTFNFPKESYIFFGVRSSNQDLEFDIHGTTLKANSYVIIHHDIFTVQFVGDKEFDPSMAEFIICPDSELEFNKSQISKWKPHHSQQLIASIFTSMSYSQIKIQNIREKFKDIKLTKEIYDNMPLSSIFSFSLASFILHLLTSLYINNNLYPINDHISAFIKPNIKDSSILSNSLTNSFDYDSGKSDNSSKNLSETIKPFSPLSSPNHILSNRVYFSPILEASRNRFHIKARRSSNFSALQLGPPPPKPSQDQFREGRQTTSDPEMDFSVHNSDGLNETFSPVIEPKTNEENSSKNQKSEHRIHTSIFKFSDSSTSASNQTKISKKRILRKSSSVHEDIIDSSFENIDLNDQSINTLDIDQTSDQNYSPCLNYSSSPNTFSFANFLNVTEVDVTHIENIKSIADYTYPTEERVKFLSTFGGNFLQPLDCGNIKLIPFLEVLKDKNISTTFQKNIVFNKSESQMEMWFRSLIMRMSNYSILMLAELMSGKWGVDVVKNEKFYVYLTPTSKTIQISKDENLMVLGNFNSEEHFVEALLSQIQLYHEQLYENMSV